MKHDAALTRHRFAALIVTASRHSSSVLRGVSRQHFAALVVNASRYSPSTLRSVACRRSVRPLCERERAGSLRGFDLSPSALQFPRRRLVKVAAFEDDLGDGVFGGVRDGEVRRRRAAACEEFARELVKDERGRARRIRDDFDVLPREAAPPARAERFERGLFRGEARGVMLWRDHAAPLAIVALAGGEDALGETRRAPQHRAHARHFDNVYAD